MQKVRFLNSIKNCDLTSYFWAFSHDTSKLFVTYKFLILDNVLSFVFLQFSNYIFDK